MFYALLVILALLVHRGIAALPGRYDFGVADKPLSSSTCTITPGPSPDVQTGYTYYSCVLKSSGKDSIVATLTSTIPGHTFGRSCQPRKGEWCVWFTRGHPHGQRQVTGGYALKGTDSITFQYNLGSDGNTWTVNAVVNNKQVLSVNANTGPLNGTSFFR